MAAALVMSMASGAAADELDDRKTAIEKNLETFEEDLDFLDDDIVQTGAKLQEFQAQLPAAQKALAEAQGRVQRASDEVTDLGRRLQGAKDSRDGILLQMAKDKVAADESRKIIGQIATQAYKQGGLSSNLSLILGAGADGNLATGMDLADQAMRSQNAVLGKLSQKGATDANSQLRLGAVEEDISGLKGMADAALAREQVERDDAEAKKTAVDGLISQTESLSAKLLAERPRIQQKLDAQQADYDKVNLDIKKRQDRLIAEAAAKKLREEAAEAKRVAAAKIAWERAQAKKAAEAKRIADAANRKKAPSEKKVASTYKKPTYVPPVPVAKPERSSWGLIKPVAGGRQTSSYGWRPTPAGTIDYGGRGGYVHAGVDWGFGGVCGAPVMAAADGEVWVAGFSGTSGNKVTISHGVVRGKALATNYHHMRSITVSVGQHVRQGQIIGYVGTTGNSTGCHMHFETVVNGSTVNPLGLL
ncbi:M23 family metallopeptidase [Paeniglutamicibacter cryotolerans]|uniref:Murein DD-endopeptidase MepM/ murein hydrolase activator NlpD n=1 Tax=Paeniglutamicibacter cryotolerans TaxID=670079 RepID=A0A839QNH4_9MICC|nr:M23 family metallopeptidase [Paeniglutamicibacter cryotolerans]MBB2996324.1 murein DD-endopeptidase MepM/ murein hydrolase activator NlpD [Paeniglutamicibacter cryotolerans]